MIANNNLYYGHYLQSGYVWICHVSGSVNDWQRNGRDMRFGKRAT